MKFFSCRHAIFCVQFFIFCSVLSAQTTASFENLPRQVFSGGQGQFHVQGIAYDKTSGCFYLSFTTSLIKLDGEGRLLGSVEGLTGHLGCLALNPDDGRLYGSIEYKHDEIGTLIENRLGRNNDAQTGFYVAIFDVQRITRPHMDARDVMTTVYISEALSDYMAEVPCGGRQVKHRFGCSGIDGVAFAPAWGKKSGRNMLYVAYGIYGDTNRTDNDYQVLLAYDVRNWKKYEQPLTPDNLHRSGPRHPKKKYFAYTGNTTYGIQNLAYDAETGKMFAAVYPGKKAEFHNYGLFAFDTRAKAHKEKLKGMSDDTKGLVVPLAADGKQSGETRGWDFKWGATGFCPIGNGLFYISHNGKQDGLHSSTIHLYRWTNDANEPLRLVE